MEKAGIEYSSDIQKAMRDFVATSLACWDGV